MPSYKVVDADQLDADLTSVADAIRAKGGTSDPLVFPTGFKTAVEAIQAGGGAVTPSAKWGDVTFIDFDGSVLYSYSLAAAQALTELPALPEHDGLICQGWNWTLDDIKVLNRPVTVGAMYITDDGATRLYIRISATGRMTVPLYIGQTVANGVSIDWGDGSDSETLAGTGKVNTSHDYAEQGDYTISLMPDDGCKLSLGAGSTSYCVLGPTGNNDRVYCNMLQSASIGRNITSIESGAFFRCYSLVSVTLPNTIASIGTSAFAYCFSLESAVIPNGITSLISSAFGDCYSIASIAVANSVTNIGPCWNCHSLASVTIPNNIAYIYGSGFRACTALSNIIIPDNVSSIGDSAFNSCYGMRCYDFSACTDVPSLSSTGVFSGIPSDCEMLIPEALYEEWSTATNWSTYASYMVAV